MRKRRAVSPKHVEALVASAKPMMDRLREQIRARLRQPSATHDGAGANSEMIVWTGTLRELGALVNDLYRRGRIAAKTPTDAFVQVSRHFVRKNGQRIDGHSLWQNFKNLQDKNAGRP